MKKGLKPRQALIALDLESVLVPEIWEEVARRHQVPELKLTTRDFPDYEALMARRLELMAEHGLLQADVTQIVHTLEPLPGALSFLAWARARGPVAILSDTFQEFAAPLMEKLGFPFLLCHRLETDESGRIATCHLRQKDSKRRAIRAFQSLGYSVIAVGDSHNDISMLKAADVGAFFRPPAALMHSYPQFPVAREYSELKSLIAACAG